MKMTHFWIVDLILLAICLSLPSKGQDQELMLLPGTTTEECRGNSSSFFCRGFGSFLAIIAPPLIPETSLIVFTPGDPINQPNTRGNTFVSELLAMSPDGNGNATFDVIFMFNNAEFGTVNTVNVTCTVAALSGGTNPFLTRTVIVRDSPRVINPYFRQDLNNSDLTAVSGEFGWDAEDAFSFTVREQNGQFDPVTTTLPRINLILNESTVYSAIIESEGLCGSDETRFVIRVSDLGEVTIQTTIDTGTAIGIGVAGFGLFLIFFILFIILLVVLLCQKHGKKVGSDATKQNVMLENLQE